MLKELSTDTRSTYGWIDEQPSDDSELGVLEAQLGNSKVDSVGRCGWVQGNMPDDLSVVDRDPGHKRFIRGDEAQGLILR
jgi:hypothetical protein